MISSLLDLRHLRLPQRRHNLAESGTEVYKYREYGSYKRNWQGNYEKEVEGVSEATIEKVV